MFEHRKKLSDIFEEGYQAFAQGRLSNPFQKNTQKYREWMRGFDTAYFDNLKRRHV